MIRPGVFPEKIMILKQDKNLAVIAERAQKDIAEVAYILTQGLLNAGLIKDDDEYYGVALKDCVDGSTPVSTIVDIIKQTGIAAVIDTDYDAFIECIVMGDGQCPECGGFLRLADYEGHKLNDGDYYMPDTFVIDEYIYRCPICGYEIRTEKDMNY